MSKGGAAIAIALLVGLGVFAGVVARAATVCAEDTPAGNQCVTVDPTPPTPPNPPTVGNPLQGPPGPAGPAGATGPRGPGSIMSFALIPTTTLPHLACTEVANVTIDAGSASNVVLTAIAPVGFAGGNSLYLNVASSPTCNTIFGSRGVTFSQTDRETVTVSNVIPASGTVTLHLMATCFRASYQAPGNDCTLFEGTLVATAYN